MTAYKKLILLWAIVMFNFSFWGLLGLYFSAWFVIPAFGSAFVANYYFKDIICPKCNTPVSYQGSIMGNPIHGGFINKKCMQCGWDLNKNLPNDG